jgi:hypothetical protein
MIRGWKRWHAVERVEISESWLVGMVLHAQFCPRSGDFYVVPRSAYDEQGEKQQQFIPVQNVEQV